MLNKTMREGVTEGTQSLVTEQTGSTAGTEVGLQIRPKQAIGEGIIGGTTAGGFDVAGRAINKGDSGSSPAQAKYRYARLQPTWHNALPASLRPTTST